MAKVYLAIFTISFLLGLALCDVYMQNPRGGNDRLNEANTNRNNGNRLFDSQNNAKGGYCIGPQMTFYEGSMLSIEWTNQHGCGSNPKLVCNIVLQYMCGTTNDGLDSLKLVRDGTTTDTIPATAAGAADPQFGMHESLQNYLNCNTRERNMGLYIADRATEGGLNTNRRTAIYTRQNNNGNRNGLECAEERDYYPYWHPSEWKDIAILTSQKQYCDFYQSNSQNVKSKGYCGDSENLGVHEAPNNPKDCEDAALTWIEQPSWGMDAPACEEVPWSRENQLGNGANGYANMFNWTLPKGVESCVDDDTCVCVLRLRYNISTKEEGYPDMNRPDTGFIDSSNNGKDSVQFQNPVMKTNNSDGDLTTELEMAADTSQFGRTFQDRSHTWVMRKRPSGISGVARIYNLNVKGKRGNIVQTYPSTEYDFIPQYLYIRLGDYIHFQWTGCDTNPAGNAGEGTAQTDRSNIVQMINAHASLPATDAWLKANKKKVLFQDPKLRLRFAMIDQPDCLPYAQVLANNGGNAGNADQDVTNCAKLNAAERYFDGGLIKMNLTGTFHYMSTRNHNFSNRDQKGIIYVSPLLPGWAIALLVVGAVICFGAFGIALAMIYAKQYPHSSVANLFSKM